MNKKIGYHHTSRYSFTLSHCGKIKLVKVMGTQDFTSVVNDFIVCLMSLLTQPLGIQVRQKLGKLQAIPDICRSSLRPLSSVDQMPVLVKIAFNKFQPSIGICLILRPYLRRTKRVTTHSLTLRTFNLYTVVIVKQKTFYFFFKQTICFIDKRTMEIFICFEC